ncbi:MAG TPA: helix-turn-helix domain-containing protein [Geminicoccaceae bacterium]|nr:helix-turn-helix domain-containing protein [Geminicoccaceae bacterium]
MADQPEQAGSPQTRRRIDWPHAARLIAQGATIAEAARQVGCSRSHLSRRCNRDPEFRAWIERRRRGVADAPDEPIPGLRRALTDAIEREVRGGNVRVLLWLADRLKLLEPPGERTPDGALHEMLRGLGPAELQEFASLRDDEGGGGEA